MLSYQFIVNYRQKIDNITAFTKPQRGDIMVKLSNKNYTKAHGADIFLNPSTVCKCRPAGLRK